MSKKASLLAAIMFAAVACSDSGPKLTPHLKFSYTGLASGTFEVTGIKTDGNTQGVLAFQDSGIVIVIGITFDPKSPIEFATLGFTAGASSVPFGPSCEAGANCSGLAISLSDPTLGLVTCTMTSGTITISSSTNKQSQGSFSGSAACTDGVNDTVLGTLEITGGSFAAEHGSNPFTG